MYHITIFDSEMERPNVLGFKIEKSAEITSILGGSKTVASKCANVHILSFITPLSCPASPPRKNKQKSK